MRQNALLFSAFGLLLYCATSPLYAHASGFQVDTNGTLTSGSRAYYGMEGNSNDPK